MMTMSVRASLLSKITLLIIIMTALIPNISVFAEDIVMVSPRSPESPDGKWFSLVYTEAFRRLGWNLIYRQYPSKRCASLSNKGKVDGELERVYDFNSAYPNLIRVNEALREIRFVAITTEPLLSLNGWESLKKKPFRVNFRRGVHLFEKMLPKVVKPEYLDAIKTPEQGLGKLLEGRTDLYLDIESVVGNAMAKKKYTGSSLHQAGVLDQVSTHPFLHKKHKERVPALSSVLKTMKAEGLFDQYLKQASGN